MALVKKKRKSRTRTFNGHIRVEDNKFLSREKKKEKQLDACHAKNKWQRFTIPFTRKRLQHSERMGKTNKNG